MAGAAALAELLPPLPEEVPSAVNEVERAGRWAYWEAHHVLEGVGHGLIALGAGIAMFLNHGAAGGIFQAMAVAHVGLRGAGAGSEALTNRAQAYSEHYPLPASNVGAVPPPDAPAVPAPGPGVAIKPPTG